MISAVAGCELDSRSIERIVEHSALPEREMLPNSPLIRSEKPRINNGHQFRPSVQSLNSPNHAYQVRKCIFFLLIDIFYLNFYLI